MQASFRALLNDEPADFHADRLSEHVAARRLKKTTVFPKRELLKTLSVAATIPACFLLFSGGYVLVHFDATYLARDLILFGVFPLLGGVCWLILAAWFWSRAIGTTSLWDCLGTVSLRALLAIVLAGLGVSLLGRFRGH